MANRLRKRLYREVRYWRARDIEILKTGVQKSDRKVWPIGTGGRVTAEIGEAL